MVLHKRVIPRNVVAGASGGDVFGSSVSISNPGDTVAVGAYLNDGSNDFLIGTKTRRAGHNVMMTSMVKTSTTPVGSRLP